MPPSNSHDAIIIALDVGKSVSKLHDGEEITFFEQSKSCVSWIIQRKIISRSKDLLSIILIGSDESDNSVTISGYDNICCKFDFQIASWDMLKFIETEVKTTENSADWIGALIVSREMLKTYEEFNNVENKKIVFFSDFTHPILDDLGTIARNLKALNVDVTIIGPDYMSSLPDEEDEMDEPPVKRKRCDKTEERLRGEKLVYELWKKLPDNIGICTFEMALQQLCSYTRKPIRLTPWNSILDIGEVKINISMFKKTDSKSGKKFDTKSVKSNENEASSSQSSLVSGVEETTAIVRDKVMYYKHQTRDGKELEEVEVTPEETIKGFRYGSTIIPFSDEDRAILEYKPGPKCFSVIGFTSISSVPYYLLSGECSYTVLPRDKDKNAEVAFSALTQAMKKMECLAIVRRVYSDNRGISLGILSPIVEEIISDETDESIYKECLLFIELAFEEDIKKISFPSLDRVAKKLSKQQLDIIDNLIDGMDLMTADKGLHGESREAFSLSSLHDFKDQFFHYCVIQRGLHPEKPIPKSLPPYIERFTRVPTSLVEKNKDIANKLKENFKIETKKDATSYESTTKESEKSKEAKTSSVAGPSKGERMKKLNELGHFSEMDIAQERNLVKSGWMKIFCKNFPNDSEMEEFLTDLMDSEIEKSEILKRFQEVLYQVRQIYLKINPDQFNSWMFYLKEFIGEKNGMDPEFWSVVVSGKLGLVSEKENKLSGVSEKEAENFLREKLTPDPIPSPKEKLPDFGSDSGFMNDLQAEQMEFDELF